MHIMIQVLNFLFRGLLFPFLLTGKQAGLFLLSVFLGISLLLLFKHISNQQAIQRAKNRIGAHILELRLYQDDIRLTLRAIGQVFYHNLRYFQSVLKPMLVFIVPVLLLIVQLVKVYDFRAYETNQAIILTAEVEPGIAPESVTLTTPDAVKLEMAPVRVNRDGIVYWRLKARQNGQWPLEIRLQDKSEEVTLHVGDTPRFLAQRTSKGRSPGELLVPVGRILPAHSFLRNIHIDYPSAAFRFLGLSVHWLLFFFIISVATGLLLKNRLGIEL